MITRLRLKNWRSHLDSSFTFSSGTNALLGRIGTGKSSCLDAICFAFFGTFPKLQTRRLKLDEVIMKKPIIKNRAEVEVSFKSNGKLYTVKRIIERGKGTTYSELREDGKLIEAPNSQRVTELVEKILKVDYDLFSKAIYSEQNALDYFLRIPRGQRMKKIDELLMIDKFEKARAGTVSLINKIAERKIGKESVIEQTDLESVQKIIDELKQVLSSYKNQKQTLQKKLEEVAKTKNAIESELSELRSVKENLEKLRMEEKGISSAIQETLITLENLETSLKKVDKTSVEKNLNFFTRLSKELESLLTEKQKELQKLQNSYSRKKAEAEMTEEKLKRLELELKEKAQLKKMYTKLEKKLGKDVDKKLEEKKLLLEKYVGEIEAYKMKVDDLKNTIEQLTPSISKCPVCGSKLTEEKRKSIIERKQSQIKSLVEKMNNLIEKKKIEERELNRLNDFVRKLHDLQIELKDYQKVQNELETTKNIFNIISESVEKAEKEVKALEKEVEDLKKKYEDVREKKQALELITYRLKEYYEKKERLEKLNNERLLIEEKIKEVEKKLEGKNLEEMDNWLKNLIAKEREISTKLSGIEQLIKEKETRLNDFESTLHTVKKAKEEVNKLEKLLEELKLFEAALKQTQTELRKEFITSVNYTMNKLWPTLYPYKDLQGIRLSIEEGDYNLQLQERSGAWVDVEGITSGGERSLAALALRIAFSLVLAPQLRILILDEPTANLDSVAITELATTLRERIGEFIDQTFLITHTPELEDAITGVGYRLERDKMQDGITKVVKLS